MPIIAGDEVLGVINIQSYERYAYSQQDLNFVSTVAGQAAAAIANARLFRERERRIRELDAINRISRAVTSTLDLQSVLERLHHGLGEIIDVSTSFIGLYDARTNILSYPICYDSGQPVHFDPIPLRGGITRWGIINRQPVLVDSAEEAASYEQDAQIARVGIEGKVEQSFLVVPIIAGDEVLGVINIQSYERNAFTHHDLNFVSTVAGQAAAAIANARLFSERDRSIQELSTLNKIGQALGSTVRFEDLLQVIYEQTSLLLDTTNFYMALYDERRYQVSYPFFYEHGQPISIPSHRLGKGLTDYVISTRQPLLITERFEEFLHEHNIQLIDEPARSWLGVPMIAADKVVGVIGIQDYEHEHAYGENEVRLLSTIANQAAQALENARLFTESRESVRELSTLSETSVSLAGTLEIEEILTIGASSAMELARSDVGGIFLIEENEGSLELGEAIFLDQLRMEIPPDEVRLKLLRTLDRLDPLREGQPVRVADAQDDPSLIGLARKLKVRGLAILPILKEQRLGGAMLIGAIQPREFEERAIASLNILGAQVGQAIENAQLFAQIRRFNSELEEMVAQRTQALAEANAMLTIEKERIEALHTIATELSATLELNEVLLRTLDLASKALNVNHGSIVLHDAENDKFICRAVLGRNGRAEAADYEVPPGERARAGELDHQPPRG
ncbi:MAG: hypothetical protein KatS3mg057_3203 [Herpetosiphonaceae bacterium]|nr:MAG: hypothetical protein KatS3mg057_3203 [Herpetosiphonaceae bacterium]